MQFTNPFFLILLIPLGYYTYRLARHSLADMSRFRSNLALGLRIAILTMLVFALAGARMVRQVSQQCVVFALDVSDSIPKTGQDFALQYVNQALGAMKGNQKAALIVFGSDASVELAPSNATKVDKLYSVPNTTNTDISQALGLALAMFPEQCAKKIVLLTDGNETRGKAIEQAMLAGSEDVSIDVVPIVNGLPQEALLDKLICPTNAKIGEPFDLKVVASSKEPTAAQIRIIRNGSPVAAKNVQLMRGKSMFTFEQSIPSAGNYEYKALLDCPNDTCPDNKVAVGYTMVKGKPRVLYVEGDTGQEKYLSTALKSSDVDLNVCGPWGIPTSLAQLRGYDAVIFSDIPAWNLDPDQMGMIKSGVRDLGIGFTMIGGENSFGAGGYFDTPIEEALPVDMSIRKTKVLPSVTTVIVIDNSGSMGEEEEGIQKVQLADDAAAGVVKLLQPIDYVGVITAAPDPDSVVPLRSARDKDPIYNEISDLNAGGEGIMVFPAMTLAAEMISASKTRQKHIILLADGDDCKEQGNTVSLAAALAAKKITVSAVAFGDGKDVGFLQAVAAAGRGGYFLARHGTDIKGIFTKDVMTISKSLLVEEPFVPVMDPTSPELAGLDQASIPPLLGYVSTSLKPAAHMSMASHKNDPILATWQYGLGKSAAFTSDCKAKWSSRWLGWSGYNKFWTQVVRSTIRKSGNGNFQTNVDVAGGIGSVTIDAVDDKGDFLNMLKFDASVVSPDMGSRPLAIEQTGPGRYEASFDAGKIGSYVISVHRHDQSDIAPDLSVLNIPYSPEYKDLDANTNLLKQISSETSGTYDPRASDVFRNNFRKTRSYTDLWWLLVAISALLLPLDVAVRRLTMSMEQALEASHRVREHLQVVRKRIRRSRRAEDRVETVGVLLQSRQQRGSVEPTTGVSHLHPGVTPCSDQADSRPTPDKSSALKGTESGAQADGGLVTSRLLEAKRRAKKKQE